LHRCPIDGLAGEADLRAAVAGLALQRAQLALRDRRRAVAVVLVLGQQVPGQHRQLAGGRAQRDLLAAPSRDAGMKRVQRAGCADRGVGGLDEQSAGVFLPGA